jgi:hypothetical protein
VPDFGGNDTLSVHPGSGIGLGAGNHRCDIIAYLVRVELYYINLTYKSVHGLVI